jgi:hypothetical protein
MSQMRLRGFIAAVMVPLVLAGGDLAAQCAL